MSSDIDIHHQDTLICWIGDTDLLAFGKYGQEHRIKPYFQTAKRVWENDKKDSGHSFDAEVEKLDLNTRNSSIILTLSHAGKDSIPAFGQIILLTNRPSGDEKLLREFRSNYASYLCRQFPNYVGNGKITIAFIPSKENNLLGVNGWDYANVHRATRIFLSSLCNDGLDADTFWYNVTPGTIAQSTTLILVAKEISHKSNFVQVEKSRRRVEHCDIPFDVSALVNQYTTNVEAQTSTPERIIGQTPCFLDAMKKVSKIAAKQVTVLITGPSGAGKEVIAREIHRLSGRPSDKFVPINCAMLSKETGVTELTGYFKGAFTGADETTPGKFDAANGGTLFLDEIGDCPADVQAELLRFLQPLNKKKPTEREWTLKGSPQASDKKGQHYKGVQHGDIRIIAATNRNLRDETHFRQDLYYRLETIQIRMPSLEERKHETDVHRGVDDIKDLADSILLNCNENYISDKDQYRVFEESAYQALREHTWTGNVRELQNVITRVVIMSGSPTITHDDIVQNLTADNSLGQAPERPTTPTKQPSLPDIAEHLANLDLKNGSRRFAQRVQEFKRAYCLAALNACNHNKRAAYSRLGINARTFQNAICSA